LRLAAAEPEFVDVTVGFRFLFAQLNSFYNINFKDIFNPKEKSGRRFDNVPCFVRKITFDLDAMKISLKLWSLGTTQFGSYLPIGVTAGGENDQIILTNLGTVGYISPVGDILSSALNTLTIADVDGANAESREAQVVGKAWKIGYKIGIFSGVDHSLIEELEILEVNGQIITLTSDIVSPVLSTIRNSAGLVSGGNYIKYLPFDGVIQDQTTFFGYFGKPIEGYPLSSTAELEEQRSGKHSFDNGRLPYVLYPKEYSPS
jgi:hypothetical protein